jgi:cytidyltransferase-like protein
MRRVYAYGAFDDPRSRDLRFLQEASRHGPLTLLLWPDEAIAAATGRPPALGLAERLYYFGLLRYVSRVEAAPPGFDPDRLPLGAGPGAGDIAWALRDDPRRPLESHNAAKGRWCRDAGVEVLRIAAADLEGFPYEAPPAGAPRPEGIKRVVATGCYDWLHTGHLRFFEEASAYGELNLVIGNDANLRLLKGEGHPLFPEAERRYVAGSFRPVARCLVSTGSGWLDAEPEILSLGIERYVVNVDGDRPEKRRYCEERGIEYIVLERTPKEGLPRRSSTALRGY